MLLNVIKFIAISINDIPLVYTLKYYIPLSKLTIDQVTEIIDSFIGDFKVFLFCKFFL